jgi:hypothetical protein
MVPQVRNHQLGSHPVSSVLTVFSLERPLPMSRLRLDRPISLMTVEQWWWLTMMMMMMSMMVVVVVIVTTSAPTQAHPPGPLAVTAQQPAPAGHAQFDQAVRSLNAAMPARPCARH